MMKNLLKLVALTLALSAVAEATQVEQKKSTDGSSSTKTLEFNGDVGQTKKIIIQVKGMVCSFCAQGIEKKFKALSEISQINVSLETKKVELSTKEGKDLPDEKVRELIINAGYDVEKIERVK